MRFEVDTHARRQFLRHEHLAHGDQVQEQVFRIEEGWALRYFVLPDGHRQITAVFLPGDYCEPQWLLSGKSDLPIVALTPVRAQVIPLAGIHARAGDCVRHLLQAVLETHARQTSWMVSLGRRSAVERVREFLAQIYVRLQAVGLVSANRCAIPLTQMDIADIVGLTPVHVNRVLADLRRQGLVQFSGRTLHLPDPGALGIPGPAMPERPAAQSARPAAARWSNGGARIAEARYA